MPRRLPKKTRIIIELDATTVQVSAELAPPHDRELPAALRKLQPRTARELAGALLRWTLEEMDRPGAALSVKGPSAVCGPDSYEAVSDGKDAAPAAAGGPHG